MDEIDRFGKKMFLSGFAAGAKVAVCIIGFLFILAFGIRFLLMYLGVELDPL